MHTKDEVINKTKNAYSLGYRFYFEITKKDTGGI